MIATEHFSAIAADFGRLKGIRCASIGEQLSDRRISSQPSVSLRSYKNRPVPTMNEPT